MFDSLLSSPFPSSPISQDCVTLTPSSLQLISPSHFSTSTTSVLVQHHHPILKQPPFSYLSNIYVHTDVHDCLLSSQSYQIILLPSQNPLKLLIKFRTQFQFEGIIISTIWACATSYPTLVLPSLHFSQNGLPAWYAHTSSSFCLKALSWCE